MAPSDTTAPFLRIPWAATLLNQPNVVTRVPGSRKIKESGEDTLFAEILKTPRTIRSCISFYIRPPGQQGVIEEVHTLMTIGDGVNGHPGLMHGGIIAAIIDEGMGILQSCNRERDHIEAVKYGKSEGELPPEGYSYFTAELKIKYLKPVVTSAPLICSARFRKREGRKEWIVAEIKQRVGADEDYYGDEVVCATGEALFVAPRTSKL
jgi:acyl-coenzyme A thioesterase PaaI-like protein